MKKVGGVRSSQGAPRSAFTMRVVSADEPPRWQVTHATEQGARRECEQRAELEGVPYYLRHTKFKDGSQHYSAIDEETFLMCGGHSAGMGRVLQVYKPHRRNDGATTEKGSVG